MNDEVIEILLGGGVGVLPTDTLYGLVASALDVDAVSRVYELKERDPEKPQIVLIADIDDVEQFGVEVSDALREQLSAYWPGPNSVLLPALDDTFEYLHRGTREIAFRLPNDDTLREFLRATGPLVAPSANTEGDAPSRSVSAARRYFGSDAEFYVDAGDLDGVPSTILRINPDGSIYVLREGGEVKDVDADNIFDPEDA